MRVPRVQLGRLLMIAGLALPGPAAASTSDSSYASADLRASTAPPWTPGRPVPSARGWETALRFPGRVASLPLVAAGGVTERSLVYLEQSNAQEKVRTVTARMNELGIVLLPASLGDDTGIGGEAGWAPRALDYRVRFDVSATTRNYNRERVIGALGPVNAVYSSAWFPGEHYFGPGLRAPLAGESAYALRTQSTKLIVSWGWQGFDTTRALRTEPLMFRDRVRLRGPLHRTWISAWAGPREASVSRGRDPDSPSFEIAHPAEATGSLNRGVDRLVYGVGFAHDGRRGLPRWSNGWRASVEAERFDKPLRVLALNDAHGDARSFTRLSYHAETAASFGRDPRTLRLALTAVDQRLDATGGTFLLSDLQSLGGSAGLAGFAPGRFRDVDLALAQLAYIFPLVTNLEFELHAETGGVYPGLSRARFASLKQSWGSALRVRADWGVIGALGCDWSSEQPRIWFTLGGLE